MSFTHLSNVTIVFFILFVRIVSYFVTSETCHNTSRQLSNMSLHVRITSSLDHLNYISYTSCQNHVFELLIKNMSFSLHFMTESSLCTTWQNHVFARPQIGFMFFHLISYENYIFELHFMSESCLCTSIHCMSESLLCTPESCFRT